MKQVAHHCLLLLLLLACSHVKESSSFSLPSIHTTTTRSTSSYSPSSLIVHQERRRRRRRQTRSGIVLFAFTRRQALLSPAAILISSLALQQQGGTLPSVAAPKDNNTSLDELSTLLQQAQRQLDTIPSLIETKKWDSVRAVLIQPPLSDCWSKQSVLLSKYAAAIGDVNGDELAALEAKEEAVTHLRFLDMAVYNNVFNPIATEGTSGATKELVRSYYEDPINEWKASKAALDELIQLKDEK